MTVNTVVITWYGSKIVHNEWQSWPVAISDQMRLTATRVRMAGAKSVL